MANRLTITGIILASLSMSGCAKHDAAYYRSHADARAEKIAACSAPDTFNNDQGCIDAVFGESDQSPEFWAKNKPEFETWYARCVRHAGILREAPVCIAVAHARHVRMGGGTPIYPTDWRLPK